MNTFHTTRIKLTAWYLVIIMLISILFSFAIFAVINAELSRFERIQGIIQERQEKGLPLRLTPFTTERNRFDPEMVSQARTRLVTTLGIINLIVLGVAGAAGYFLAGKTLRPIKKMMDEQNRFITDASHELKTPLTSLRSEYEVAMLDEKNITLNEAKRLIKSGFEEIVGLQGLAENLIELTQQQKRIGYVKVEDVSLLEVIEAALKKVVPLAKQNYITISNEIDDYLLKGERQSLTELFVILLDNSIKYGAKKSEVKLVSEKTDNHVQIEVLDKGIGIDEKDLPYIFDRFYRADKSRSETPGYGLGLSIAKQIVETHRGSISVQSKLNKGTKIVVQLPIANTRT